jgi:hypothetical protein
MKEEKKESIKDKIFELLMLKYDVENLLVWNEFTIADKLPKQAFLEVQWREMYISQNKLLEELEREKIELEGQIFMEVRHPQMVEEKNPYSNIGAGLQTKEIEKYVIPRDKRIKEINKKIEMQGVIVEFFLSTHEAIKKNTWHMKNWIEIYKRG